MAVIAESVHATTQIVSAELSKKAFLLTWNPKKYSVGGSGTDDYGLNLKIGDIERWSCNTTQIKNGDDVYLIRLGVEPRGIVIKGVVVKESYKAEDWAGTEDTKRYIDFRVEELRMDCASGLLPMILLNTALPEQAWSIQSSGVAIREEVSPQLEALWNSGRGKHSLKQFVEWTQQDSVQQRSDWRSAYIRTVGICRDIIDGRNAIDDVALEEIWKGDNSGVTTIAPGFLSHDDFEKNKSLLREFTVRIANNPDAATMRSIRADWEKAKSQKQFRQMYNSAINRAFAGFDPSSYTTIVNVKDCRDLLDILNESFQFKESASDDWIALNASIKRCMAEAALQPDKVLVNNIGIWQILKNTRKRLPAESSIQNEITNEAVAESQSPTESFMNEGSKNCILYGPPGTGKTYNTINEALRILEPELLADPMVEREELLEAFNRYKAAGQVVFCTFHQSFSYEDFVEGLRANTDNGQVRYSVEAGIFKQLCQEAAKISDQPTADELLNGFIEQVAENPVTLETSRGKRFAVSYKYGNSTLTCLPEASGAGRDLPANISHIRQYMQGIRPGNIYCESYVKGIADHINAQLPLSEVIQQSSRVGVKPFVLIIDEINRGNISRIFGELITLIEPSKRAGEPEALSVQLPYSKEPFSVPSNVNLIGTMNTADRSLASLDIALRRRFTFKEMPPIYEDLDKIDVAGLNIGLLLRKMNARIEVLLDRDHCLGHAYFLPLRKENTLDKLAFIFRQQILPLLQEYFFEDWERIAWVLNDQNKDAALQFIQKADSNLASLFDAETAGKLQDRRWLINETAFKNIASYKAILGASE